MPKFYGEMQEASLENLAVDPGGSSAGRVWHNTATGQVKVDDGSLKRALLKNDQKAIIGNSATANENIRLHRGAIERIQFVKAGDTTAEGSLSSNLAQISGRLENYTSAGKPAAGNIGRTIYITDEESFAIDNGTSWDKIRLLRPQIAQSSVTNSAAYTAVVGSGVNYANAASAGFTVTLPSATGVDGEEIVFQKTDSTFNVVTIGAITTLNTQNENVIIRSNGAIWIVISRHIPDAMATYTPTFNNFGTSTGISFRYWRSGRELIMSGSFTAGTAAAAAAGFTMPSGVSIDTALLGTNSIPVGSWAAGNVLNSWGYVIYANSAGTLFFNRAGVNLDISNANAMGSNGQFKIGMIRVPISGWNS